MAEGNYPFPSTYITFSVTTGAATPLPLPLTLTLSLTLTR